MYEVDDLIGFYNGLIRSTSVPDLQEFYSSTVKYLEDYKYIQLAQYDDDDEGAADISDLSCGCCGSHDLFDAYLSTAGTMGIGKYGAICAEFLDQNDEVSQVLIRRARCCRHCGHVMPYINMGYDD